MSELSRAKAENVEALNKERDARKIIKTHEESIIKLTDKHQKSKNALQLIKASQKNVLHYPYIR